MTEGAKVVGIGEGMIELTRAADDSWRMGSAGDTLNTVRYLARLGVPTAYVTALGTDSFSGDMIRQWRSDGLDTSLVLTDPIRLPGLYTIETDPHGERSFHYWRAQSAATALFALQGIDAVLSTACTASLLYLSGITLSIYDAKDRARLLEVARAVRTAGGDVAFDPNYRPRGWPDAETARAAIETFAATVSIALPTFDDEVALYGDASPAVTVDRWRSHGAREVAVKLGRDGCYAVDAAGRAQIGPDKTVVPKDTTGAGDAFNASYLAVRLTGGTIAEAGRFANRLAGLVIQYPGAMIPAAVMPTLA